MISEAKLRLSQASATSDRLPDGPERIPLVGEAAHQPKSWASHGSRSGVLWSLETAKMIAEIQKQQAKRCAENAAKASLS